MNKYIVIFLFLLLPHGAHAAELSFTEPYDTVSVGSVFTIDLYLDPQSDTVNALGGTVLVPPGLAMVSVSTEGSVVPLWVEAPQRQKDEIVFAGVLPGGYRGTVSAEWVGYRAGKIFSLTLRALQEGDYPITFSGDTRAYLNDGSGTPAPLHVLATNIHVVSDIAAPTSSPSHVIVWLVLGILGLLIAVYMWTGGRGERI